jgi:hypothetical protein
MRKLITGLAALAVSLFSAALAIAAATLARSGATMGLGQPAPATTATSGSQ